MGNILITLGTLMLLFISGFMILIILMQRANTNAGLGTAFGGGVAESAFGADTGNVLTKGTVIAIVAFFILSLCLYLGHLSASNAATGQGIDSAAVIDSAVADKEAIEQLMDAAAVETTTEAVLESETSGLSEAASALTKAGTATLEEEAATVLEDIEGAATEAVEALPAAPAQ